MGAFREAAPEVSLQGLRVFVRERLVGPCWVGGDLPHEGVA